MGKNKNPNIINVGKVRTFLKKAYGLDSQVVNFYHLKIRHEDYDGWFDWYHTTGSVVKTTKGSNGEFYPGKFATCTDDEDLAIKIIEAINN